MISQLYLIMWKEFISFFLRDRAVFIVHLIMIIGWSAFFITPSASTIDTTPLWVIFFALFSATSLTNSIFVSERITGAIEIVITSGISRKSMLFGKMLFMVLSSIAIGLLCATISLISRNFLIDPYTKVPDFNAEILYLFLCSVFFVTSTSAFFSVWLSNPRMVHIINMVLLAFLSILVTIIKIYFSDYQFLSYCLIILFSVFFTWATVRLYNSEKISKPINL